MSTADEFLTNLQRWVTGLLLLIIITINRKRNAELAELLRDAASLYDYDADDR